MVPEMHGGVDVNVVLKRAARQLSAAWFTARQVQTGAAGVVSTSLQEHIRL